MPAAPPPSPSSPRNPNTAVRRALLWWFQAPAVAHVSMNIAVDFTAARAYLESLATQEGPKVSVQHLLAAAVARTLAEFPLANAHIVGNRIRMRPDVGIAMPVNLLGHPGGAKRELGLMVLQGAQALTLREVAAASTRDVHRERKGEASNPVVRYFVALAGRAPQATLFAAMDSFERLRQVGPISDLFYRIVPVTTLLSNPGAAFPPVPGMLFRGVSLAPPHRLAHVGTVWGSSFVQEEAVVIDGRVEVRPMLPVVLIFDHRLLDGVAAGRMLQRFAQILQDPQAELGVDGRELSRG